MVANSLLSLTGLPLMAGAAFAATEPPAAVGNVTIVEYGSGERVAPYGADFTAESLTVSGITQNLSGGYDESFNALDYVWTVDGSPIAAPPAFLNIPTAWKDHNLRFGQKASFVLPAGSHTIRLKVYNQGTLVADDTHSVVVSDPDDVYTGTRTLLWSPSNDFSGISGELLNADQATTQAQVETWLSNMTNTGRILLRADEAFTMTTQLNLNPSASGNVRLGTSSAFGGSGRPAITTAVSQVFNLNNANGSLDFCVHGIDITATTKFSAGGTTSWPWTIPTSASASTIPTVVFHDIIQDGFTGADGFSTTTYHHVIFNDYHYIEWNSYAMFIFGGDDGESSVSLNGFQFTPPGSGTTTTVYSCIRIPRSDGFSVSMSNLTGSSASSSSYSQIPLRLAADASQYSRAILERTVVECNPDTQSSPPISINGANALSYDGPINVLIHNCLIINRAGYNTTAVGVRNGGVRVSNCIYLWDGAVIDGHVGCVERSHTTEELDYPVLVYNNTLASDIGTVSGWSGAYARNIGASGFTNIVDQNNTSNVSTDDGSPLDESTALAGFTSLFGLSTPTYQPQSGSSALDSATTGLVAFDDILNPGTARTTPSKGAVEA